MVEGRRDTEVERESKESIHHNRLLSLFVQLALGDCRPTIGIRHGLARLASATVAFALAALALVGVLALGVTPALRLGQRDVNAHQLRNALATLECHLVYGKTIHGAHLPPVPTMLKVADDVADAKVVAQPFVAAKTKALREMGRSLHQSIGNTAMDDVFHDLLVVHVKVTDTGVMAAGHG